MMKIENWEQIDADMQRGYSHAMANESVQACIEWKKTWSAIVAAMDSGGYASTEEFDEDFSGLQCVFNWASDYEIELLNAVADDVTIVRDWKCSQRDEARVGQRCKRHIRLT